jgi:hypothetical protein
MPIIFPTQCMGATAGGLQQLKQQGHTSAGGGLFHQDYLDQLVIGTPGQYFRHTEPAGIFMDKLEQTKQQIEDNTEAIRRASHVLVDTAKDANKSMADVSGKMRDGADKLSFAIDKMMKVTGRTDFAHVVALTESLVDSLERLAALEQKGLLEKVMQAMQARA